MKRQILNLTSIALISISLIACTTQKSSQNIKTEISTTNINNFQKNITPSKNQTKNNNSESWIQRKIREKRESEQKQQIKNVKVRQNTKISPKINNNINNGQIPLLSPEEYDPEKRV